MNRPRLIAQLVLLGVLAGWMPAAWVMGASPQLPADVRTTTNSQSVHQPIQTFVDAQIAKLTNEDPTVQSQAREQISAETSGGGSSKPTDPFLDAYSEILANSLKNLANNKDPRVRLNVAIIVYNVAKAGNSPRFGMLVIDLMDDPSEAVVIWAIKASKYVIPPILGNAIARQQVPIMEKFLATVQKHLKSGPIIQSAYESLRLENTGPNAVPPANWKVVVPAAVDAFHAILHWRIAQYQSGVPVMPASDLMATTFLVDSVIWPVQSDPQKLESVQQMLDLVSVVSKRWSDSDLNKKQDLTEVYNKTSSAIWVVGQKLGSDKIMAVSGNNKKVIPSTTPGEIEQDVEMIRGALKTVPIFAALKAPPPVSAMNPTATPSTQPTSAAASPPNM